MTFVLALEAAAPAGLTTFTSPVSWGPEGPTVVINGRTRTTGYTVLSSRQVTLDVPALPGDVVGFMVSA